MKTRFGALTLMSSLQDAGASARHRRSVIGPGARQRGATSGGGRICLTSMAAAPPPRLSGMVISARGDRDVAGNEADRGRVARSAPALPLTVATTRSPSA